MHSDFDAADIYRISSDAGVPSKEPDPVRVDRQRGLWSFLTRTFFLGQLLAAQQMLSGSANTSQAEAATAQQNDGRADAPAGALPSRESVGSLPDNGASAERLPSGQLNDDGQASGKQLGADLAKPSGAEAANSVTQANVGAAGGSATSPASISASSLSPNTTGGASPPPSVPGDGASTPIIQLPLPVLEPDINVGGSVAGVSVHIGVGNEGLSADINLANLIDVDVTIPISTGEVVLPVIDLALAGVQLSSDGEGVSAGIDLAGLIDADVTLPISPGEVLLPVIDVAVAGIHLSGDGEGLSAGIDLAGLIDADVALPISTAEVLLPVIDVAVAGVHPSGDGEGVSTGIDLPDILDAGVTLPISPAEVLLPVIEVTALGVHLADSQEILGDALPLDVVSDVAAAAPALDALPADGADEIIPETLQPEPSAVPGSAAILTSALAEEAASTGEPLASSLVGSAAVSDEPAEVVDEALPAFSPAIASPLDPSSSATAVELDVDAAPGQTDLAHVLEPLSNDTGDVQIVAAEILGSTGEDSTDPTAEESATSGDTLAVAELQLPATSSPTPDVVSPGVIALADAGEDGPSNMLFDTYSALNIELQMEPGPSEPLQSVDAGVDDLLPQFDSHETSDAAPTLPDIGRSPFADLFG